MENEVILHTDWNMDMVAVFYAMRFIQGRADSIFRAEGMGLIPKVGLVLGRIRRRDWSDP